MDNIYLKKLAQYRICILTVLIGILLDMICSIFNVVMYPQIILNEKNIYGESGENLKDFSLREDGNIVAESEDPWAFYTLVKETNVKIVQIFVENVEPEGVWSELHFIHEDGRWLYKGFNIHSGVNKVELNTGYETDKVTSIRFDFTAGNNNSNIKIDKVIINNRHLLMMKYHFLILFVVLVLIAVELLRKKKYNVKQLQEIFVGIILFGNFSFLICVFASLDLYFNNQEEFWFDIYYLLPVILMMFFFGLIIGSVTMLMLYLIHKKAYYVGVTLTFIMYICTYIQGNFLVKELPPLNGTEYQWEDYSWGRVHTLLLWCIVLIIVLVLLKKININKFFNIIKYISIGITLMLVVTLGIECITTDGYQNKLDASVTIKDQFEMSLDKNFVILILDMLDTEMFNEVLEDNIEYKTVFSDFTYYPNTMGAYPYTKLSIPFILSGEWFENKESFAKYNENVYKVNNLFDNLKQENYKLVIDEMGMPLTDKSIYQFDNVLESDIKIKSYLQFAQLELKLVGFKYAPFGLKKLCKFYTSDFDLIRENSSTHEYRTFTGNNRQFYDDICNQIITLTNQKCFKFIHIEGAHVPFRYDKNMNIVKNGTYEQNIESCITIVNAYLKKLKSSDVYDNSAIIIMADHGYNYDKVEGRQDPLLMIKGVDEHHEMLISNAPISYADLQEAYKRLLDGKKNNMVFKWKEGDIRERRYLWQKDWLDSNHLVEYIQVGEASDISTMKPTGKQFSRK